MTASIPLTDTQSLTLEALDTSGGYATTATVVRRLDQMVPNVIHRQGTVYNTLSLLEKRGVVKRGEQDTSAWSARENWYWHRPELDTAALAPLIEEWRDQVATRRADTQGAIDRYKRMVADEPLPASATRAGSTHNHFLNGLADMKKLQLAWDHAERVLASLERLQEERMRADDTGSGDDRRDQGGDGADHPPPGA